MRTLNNNKVISELEDNILKEHYSQINSVNTNLAPHPIINDFIPVEVENLRLIVTESKCTNFTEKWRKNKKDNLGNWKGFSVTLWHEWPFYV